MKCFDILGISEFSSKREIESAYNNKVQEIKADPKIYSETIYIKKFDELDEAREKCLEHADSIKKDYSFDSWVIGAATVAVPTCIHVYIVSEKWEDFGLCGDLVACFFGGWCWRLLAGAFCGAAVGAPIGTLLPLSIKCTKTCSRKCTDRKHKLTRKRLIRKKQKSKDKEIKTETKEIKKNTKNVLKAIQRYKDLNDLTSCDVDNISNCQKLVSLISYADLTAANGLKIEFEKYEKIANEKAACKKNIEEIAQLYRDIGNGQAAKDLLNKIEIED